MWECSTVSLQRRSRDTEWCGEVPIAGAAAGRLIGLGIMLNAHAADAWELVSLLPLTYHQDEQGLYAATALAVFKRPVHLTAAFGLNGKAGEVPLAKRKRGY